jgi:1,4-dihydroxy-2-naphthoate octaprenyltransferase
MNKKGNIFEDMLLAPVLLALIAISIVTGTYMWNAVEDNTTIFSQENGAQNRIHHATQVTVDMFPFIFTMIFISLLVGLAVTGYFVRSSPLFLVLGILIIAIVVVISAPLSNMYLDLVNNSDFSGSESRIITLIMSNLPLMVLMMGFVFLIALYAKKSSGGVGII